jgi:hypothetical protein
MRDLGSRRAAVALWMLLGAVAVATLTIVIGNLAPAALPHDACNALGFVTLGLLATAHVLPVAAGLARALRAPAPLALAAGEA